MKKSKIVQGSGYSLRSEEEIQEQLEELRALDAEWDEEDDDTLPGLQLADDQRQLPDLQLAKHKIGWTR